jgi:hypothetical protein
VVALVRLPEVPVIVIVVVPVVAVLLAVSVNVLVLAVLVGLNDAVTPDGRPDADKPTFPLKPFCGVTVIVLVVPVPPCVTVTVPGDADNVKFGINAAFTVSEREVVLFKAPELPATVIVTVPVVAVPLAVSVNVLVLAVLAGLKDAVTPEGRPDADRLTFPLKPFSGVTVIMLVPTAPCDTVKVFGDADRLKLGGALTVRDTLTVEVKLPDVPVMVTVAGPVVAVLLAVNVKVLVVLLVELNEAVTPEGKPAAVKLTLPLKPFCGVTVIVLVPLAPCVIATLVGDADSVKLAAGGGGVVTETLSKVALPRTPAVPLSTARPTYTVCPMVIVWLLAICVQFTPSAET